MWVFYFLCSKKTLNVKNTTRELKNVSNVFKRLKKNENANKDFKISLYVHFILNRSKNA